MHVGTSTQLGADLSPTSNLSYTSTAAATTYSTCLYKGGLSTPTIAGIGAGVASFAAIMVVFFGL